MKYIQISELTYVESLFYKQSKGTIPSLIKYDVTEEFSVNS